MISELQLEKLKHDLLGTFQPLELVLERLQIDASVDEAEDRLLDGAMAIECCFGCGVWHESALMEQSDERHGPVCQQCEPELFE